MAKESGEPYISRGKKTIQMLAEEARRIGQDCLRIVEEKAKKPAHVAIIRIDEAGKWRWEGAA
jgi:rRNA maturation protein Rpf1